MNCEQARELISASLDGMLSREEERALAAHIESCAECKKEMEELKALTKAMADLPDVEPPADLHEKGMARVRAYKKPFYRKMSVITPLAAAACVLIIAVSVAMSGANLNGSTSDDGSINGNVTYDEYTKKSLLSDAAPSPTSAPAAVAPDSPIAMRNSADLSYSLEAQSGSSVTGIYGGVAPSIAPSPTNAPVPADGQSDPERGPKIIYTGDVSLLTTSFDADQLAIIDMITAASGYVESDNLYGLPLTDPNGGGRTLNVTARVPAENFDFLLSTARGVGQLQSGSRYGSDITASYTDTETRLYVLKEQLTRLEDLAKKSEIIDDVLKVQLQMTELVYQIESLQGTLRRYDAQVNYATVHITLQETVRLDVVAPVPVTLSQRIQQRTTATLTAVRDAGERFVIAVVGSLPVTLPLLAVAVLAFFIIRSLVKRRRM